MVEEQFWQLSIFSQEVGMHFTTVNNWFDALEKKKIHYINRRAVDQKKIYDTLDLKIGLYIKEKREANWSLDAIYSALKDTPPFELRSFPLDYKDESTELSTDLLLQQLGTYVETAVNQAIEKKFLGIEALLLKLTSNSEQFEKTAIEQSSDIQTILELSEKAAVENSHKSKAEELQISTMQLELQNLLAAQEEAFQKKILQLEEDNKNKALRDRQQRITDMITEKRIESILELEALNEWSKLPNSERLIKSGFLRKEENQTKKQQFIKNYIQKNYESRFIDEMGNQDMTSNN